MLVKVGSRGQITIPKDLRDSLNIQPGDSVAITQEGQVLKLQRVTKTLFDMVGSISSDHALDWDEMRQLARERAAQRVMESLQDE